MRPNTPSQSKTTHTRILAIYRIKANSMIGIKTHFIVGIDPLSHLKR